MFGRLEIGLDTRGVGGEPGFENHVLVIQIEVHAGVVDQCGLMNVDVKAIVGLHLQ